MTQLAESAGAVGQWDNSKMNQQWGVSSVQNFIFLPITSTWAFQYLVYRHTETCLVFSDADTLSGDCSRALAPGLLINNKKTA